MAARRSISHAEADAAGDELGLSGRHVYELVARWRRGSGLVTDLAVGHSEGGKDRGRIAEAVESVIDEALRGGYVKRQRPRLAVVYRDIARVCRERGLPVPARNTVARRVAAMDPREVVRAREGTDAARRLQLAGGAPPPVARLLQQVQIDHTVIDVIVVAERDRSPIGRPYLTFAIDVSSRCLLGIVVTLEAPPAVSVGLCLRRVEPAPPYVARGLD